MLLLMLLLPPLLMLRLSFSQHTLYKLLPLLLLPL